ncbi:Cell division protein kinase [Spraguea lophii 42_110]|uniref:Cell division protein kinase n=1 Tax=Spraguea lophii (strain 42_110) TaxID=1358809 RepID=S7XG55_SPRLO|nr:Cell division protein kinase [Spraguea lophii 42_110]
MQSSDEEGEIVYRKPIAKNNIFEYNILNKIGEGTFGIVYLSTKGEKSFALKKMIFENNQNGLPLTTIREIKVLKSLKHKNIINIIDIVTNKIKDKGNVYEKYEIFVVFPYVNTDLSRLIRKELIKRDDMKYILLQIIEGLNYLHENNVIHRDLKSSNILVNDNMEIKIADFGLARVKSLKNDYTPGVVTLWYRPPEILLGSSNYDEKIDIWSYGVIAAEIFQGVVMFQGNNEITQLEKIIGVLGTINERTFKNIQSTPYFSKFKLPQAPVRIDYALKGIESEKIKFVKQILIIDPEKRPTTKEILKNVFFKKGLLNRNTMFKRKMADKKY